VGSCSRLDRYLTRTTLRRALAALRLLVGGALALGLDGGREPAPQPRPRVGGPAPHLRLDVLVRVDRLDEVRVECDFDFAATLVAERDAQADPRLAPRVDYCPLGKVGLR